jgi:hypothetical protein
VLDPEHPLSDVPEEGPASVEIPAVEVKEGRIPSSMAPPSVVARHMDRLAHAAQVLEDHDGSVFHPDMATALQQRDAQSIKDLADSARGHTHGASERLDAIAELAGGRSGEALRRLRRAKERAASEDLSSQCRATLALAVALLAAGRPYEAALEGLGGIARARQGQDERGERACARFLSQVAKVMGDQTSAQAWASLGQ